MKVPVSYYQHPHFNILVAPTNFSNLSSKFLIAFLCFLLISSLSSCHVLQLCLVGNSSSVYRCVFTLPSVKNHLLVEHLSVIKALIGTHIVIFFAILLGMLFLIDLLRNEPLMSLPGWKTVSKLLWQHGNVKWSHNLCSFLPVLLLN